MKIKRYLKILAILIVPSMLLGLTEYTNCNKLTAYPNPSRGSVTMFSCKANQPLNIFNVNGQIIFSSITDNFGRTTWNEENISSGIYVAEVGGLTTKIAVLR